MATTGYYQGVINEMMYQDEWEVKVQKQVAQEADQSNATQWYGTSTSLPYSTTTDPWAFNQVWTNHGGLNTYAKPPHRCQEVPKHLESYYSQLVHYHRQAGYRGQEGEKICCILKKLGIKY